MMMFKRSKKLVMLAAVAALAASTAAGASSALAQENRPAARLDDATALFGALRQDPVRSIPVAVERAIALAASSRQPMAIDPSQVRARTIGDHTIYLAPAPDGGGVCVVIADGSGTCSDDLDGIKAYGLAFQTVPALAGRIDPLHPPADARPGPGTTTLYGIVPDGVTSVTATTARGEQLHATVEGNAYVLKTDGSLAGVTTR